MTKIEIFKKEKSQHASMVDQAYKSQNLHQYKDSRRDKFGLSIGGKWHDHGEPMGYLTGHSGFYGSSGCSYECSPRLAEYLRIVINKEMEQLVEKAILLSEIEVEKTRLAAEAEAKMVLQEAVK